MCVTNCLAVLGNYCGGSISSPPSPPNLHPPSLKWFSGPILLCVPPSGEGGSAAAAFHCLWGD